MISAIYHTSRRGICVVAIRVMRFDAPSVLIHEAVLDAPGDPPG